MATRFTEDPGLFKAWTYTGVLGEEEPEKITTFTLGEPCCVGSVDRSTFVGSWLVIITFSFPGGAGATSPIDSGDSRFTPIGLAYKDKPAAATLAEILSSEAGVTKPVGLSMLSAQLPTASG